MKIQVLFKKLNENAIAPYRKNADDAGFDIHASEHVVLLPGEIKLISTGIAIAFESGYKCEVCPRSGLACKGFTIVNSPGTVDAPYRGEIKIIAQNCHQSDQIIVNPGDRIAQLIFVPIADPVFQEVQDLPISVRGADGFGSSGVKAIVEDDRIIG